MPNYKINNPRHPINNGIKLIKALEEIGLGKGTTFQPNQFKQILAISHGAATTRTQTDIINTLHNFEMINWIKGESITILDTTTAEIIREGIAYEN